MNNVPNAIAVVFFVTTAGCASRASVAPPMSPAEPAPPLDERALAMQSHDEAHASVVDALQTKPRIRETVTLGHADAEPMYRVPFTPTPVAQAPVTNVTVINQVPTYGFGFGGFYGGGFNRFGGYGYNTRGFQSSYSRGSTTAPGNIAGANWNNTTYSGGFERGTPSRGVSAPAAVGGDWRPVRDYGPRPMR